MNNLEKISKDFYDCVNIPIRYIDSNFNVKHNISSSSIDVFIDELEIYKDINKNEICTNQILNYDNIHFIIKPFQYRGDNGFFVVGPFKTLSTLEHDHIPFKPIHCINHLENILKYIIKEIDHHTRNFSKYIYESVSYIRKHYSNDIKIDDICSHLNINKSYFCRLFKSEMGLTFSQFLNAYRIERSKELLKNKEYSILDVAMEGGYKNHNYYSSLFKKFNKITPLDYRNQYIY